MHLFYGVYDSLLRLIEKEIIDTKILASIHLSMFLRLMGHIGKKKRELVYYSSTNSQEFSLITEDRFVESNRRSNLMYYISLHRYIHSIVINNYT